MAKAEFGLTSYDEDIQAIHVFFLGESPNNDQSADVILKEWFPWYDAWKKKGWYDQHFNKDLWNEARAIRDRYNKVNGTPVPPYAVKAEDLGQAQPLGGLLGDVPSDIATKGVVSGLWKNLPTGGKVGVTAIGLLVLRKLIK